MDGGMRVVSAGFRFEGATSMEVPFVADKLEQALFWLDHGVREKQGSFGIMLDPWKGKDETCCIWKRSVWICRKDRTFADINNVASGENLNGVGIGMMERNIENSRSIMLWRCVDQPLLFQAFHKHPMLLLVRVIY